MKSIAALPVLIAFLVGALPAHAWTWPVAGPVLQPFQLGSDPYAAGQHRGVDVGAPPGTAVVAPTGGVVSFAGTLPRSGRTITIATPDGLAVTLVHLGAIGVARGATVKEGGPVGTVGPTGDPEHAEGYVHLGVRVASDPHGYVDPESLLPAPSVPVPAEEAEAGDDVPAEPPQEEESAPPEPGGESEAGAPQPDPAGETESPGEPGSEEAPGDPPPAAEPVPEPGEHAPVPAEGEPGKSPVEPDRSGVEAPAVPGTAGPLPVLSGVADSARLQGQAGDVRHGRDTQTAPSPKVGRPLPVTGPMGARPENLSGEASRASTEARGHGAPSRTSPDGGAGSTIALALAAAALAALGGTLGAKRRRGSSPPARPGTDDVQPTVGALEMLGEHAGHGDTASAEVDLWLAELLSPGTPCPSRLVRDGRAGARRRSPPRRRATPSRAAPARGARSARAGWPPRGALTRS